jgi:hypothetical protein
MDNPVRAYPKTPLGDLRGWRQSEAKRQESAALGRRCAPVPATPGRVFGSFLGGWSGQICAACESTIRLHELAAARSAIPLRRRAGGLGTFVLPAP